MDKSTHQHQEIVFYNLFQIIGNKKSNPPISGRLSISRSTWLSWVKDGLAPAPIKLGVRSNAWPAHEIAALSQARIAGKTNDEIKQLVQGLHAARVTK
ncbi:MAG: helix-turn-helix transcriptional regulator [Methylobacter sp.]